VSCKYLRLGVPSTVRLRQPSSLGMSWNLNCIVTEGLYEQQINKRLYFVRSHAVHGKEPSDYSINVEMERCWFRMSNSDVPADVTLYGGVSDFRRCGGVYLGGLNSQRRKLIKKKRDQTATPDQKTALTELSPGAYETCSDIKIPII